MMEHPQSGRDGRPADLLLKNARLVNVLSGEIHRADIALRDGRVFALREMPSREVRDLEGRYVCPGFMDAHVHLESAMVTPSEFCRAVLPHGTTAVVCDPHEVANVAGTAGIRYILNASKDLPLRVFVMLPSCVPATPLETAGAELKAADLGTLWDEDRVIGLAEVMNVPGVLAGDPDMRAKIRSAGVRPVDGHAPGLTGADLDAYILAGIQTDHECSHAKEALEKLRRGMRILIREGTAARNLLALLPAVTAANSRFFSFCTDDRHPETLLHDGHMDDVLHKAIAAGLDPLLAVQMATINTAQAYGLKGLGAVAPGYQADLLVLDDLPSVRVRDVYVRGVLAAREGHLITALSETGETAWPAAFHVDTEALDFTLAGGAGPANVIGVVPGQIVTEWLRLEPKQENGRVASDPGRDLLKIAVVERHRGSGRMGLGLIHGFGLQRGALASSVAHDSHNIVAVGVSDEDLRAAVAAVVAMEGGQVVTAGGRVLAQCPLPIGGLLSRHPLEQVASDVSAVNDAARSLGCPLADPLMTLSFMALPVLPFLKITDRGLVDVQQFGLLSLYSTPGPERPDAGGER